MNTVRFTDDERRVLLFAVGQEICAQIHVVVTADIPESDKTMAIFKRVGGLYELRTLMLYAHDGAVTVSEAGLKHLAQVFVDMNPKEFSADVILDARRLRGSILEKLVGGQTLKADDAVSPTPTSLFGSPVKAAQRIS